MEQILKNIEKHLHAICLHPSRHVGSPGVAAAADYIEETLRGYGFTDVKQEKFDTTGWRFGHMIFVDLDNGCIPVPGALPCFFSQSTNVEGVPLWLTEEEIKKIDTILLFDAMTPAMAIGHACGRIGCFLQGCCFGSPTTFLGVRYPAASEAVYKYGNVAVHPVQLYEAAANLVAFYFFFRLVRNCKRGVAMSSYLIYYGVTRFLIELMRGDNPHLWGLFTPAQLIGLVLIPTGVFLLLYFKKNAAKNA